MSSTISLLGVLQSAVVVVAMTSMAQTIIPHKDHQSSCVARNKAVGQAILAYMDDCDQRFPPLVRFAANPDGACSYYNPPWSLLIKPYLKDWMDLRCPADPHAIAGDLNFEYWNDAPAAENRKLISQALRTNRGYNAYFLSPLYHPRQFIPTSLSDVADPASTLLCVDSAGTFDSDGNPVGGGVAHVQPPAVPWPVPGGVLPDYVLTPSWSVGINGQIRIEGLQFGGTFGFHSAEPSMLSRHTVVLFVDGTSQVVPMQRLLDGTSLDFDKSGHGSRHIVNSRKFLWDLE